MEIPGIIIFAIVALAIALLLWTQRGRLARRQLPDNLKPGQPLPTFSATDEHGNQLDSSDLRGSPAVLLFVRGSWCPFCSRQVANLTKYYKEIANTAARLILVTPRPLDTTRRVAEFFEVDFEFWLDESLVATRKLGLLAEAGVPKSYEKEYGEDTIWPTSLVVDANGIIRFAELSKFIADRPDPKKLLDVVSKL